MISVANHMIFSYDAQFFFSYKQIRSIQVRFFPYILVIRCTLCIDKSYIAKNSAQFLNFDRVCFKGRECPPCCNMALIY